jgi:hypothetical protein
MRWARWFWKEAGLLLTALVGLTGCTTYNHLRPPKPPEDFTLPPQNDSRYSMPVEYPKDTQNTSGAQSGNPGGAGGRGGRGGMGGGGMGGGGMGGGGMGGMGGMGGGMGGMGR